MPVVRWKSRRLLRLVGAIVVVLIKSAGARLTFYDTRRGQNISIPTVRFVFYGSHTSGRDFAGPILVTEENLCEVTRSQVQGSIVIQLNYVRKCPYAMAYERLFEKGAIALAYISVFPKPGLHIYHHRDWNVNAHRGEKWTMPMALLHMDDKMYGYLLGANPNAVLTPTLPDQTSFEALFQSLHWTLVLRALIPCFGFYVAARTFKEARRLHKVLKQYSKTQSRVKRLTLRKKIWIIGCFVCFAESIALASFMAVMVAGNFGPTMLPAAIHNLFFSIMAGNFTYCTIAIAVMLHEQLKTINQAKTSAWDWRLGRAFLTILFIFSLVADLLVTVSLVLGEYTNFESQWYSRFARISQGSMTFSFVACMCINAAVGIFFCLQAFRLRRYLSAYIRHRYGNAHQTLTRRLDGSLGRSALIMLANGMAMLFAWTKDIWLWHDLMKAEINPRSFFWQIVLQCVSSIVMVRCHTLFFRSPAASKRSTKVTPCHENEINEGSEIASAILHSFPRTSSRGLSSLTVSQTGILASEEFVARTVDSSS